jgi:hypothetical protein
MALVRCKSCGIDTSDSLERCPICGGSPTAVGFASAVAAAKEAAGRAADAGVDPEAAARALKSLFPRLRGVPRIVWIVGALVILATVPHAFPILVVLTILWMIASGRSRGHERGRAGVREAREIFGGQASSIRQGTDKPLEHLRGVERRLKRHV